MNTFIKINTKCKYLGIHYNKKEFEFRRYRIAKRFMKIKHLPDNHMLLWDWCIHTTINDIPRFYTHVDNFCYKYTITDRWTGNEFTKEHFTTEKEIYLEIEKIAKSKPNTRFQEKIIEFNKRQEIEFDDPIKNKLFDAWLYNTYIHSQVYNMVNPTYSIHTNPMQISNQIRSLFTDCLKYYYERTTNTIVLLADYEVVLHKHFWISMDYEGSEIENIVLKYFKHKAYKHLDIGNSYFDRNTYNKLIKRAKELETANKTILKFKNTLAENWLKYINKQFLSPISFSNRDFY